MLQRIKKYTVAGLIAVVAACAILAYLLMTRGDGSFTRLTTVKGLYAVPNVGGYKVVCFVNSVGDAISCLPERNVRNEQQ